MPCSPAAHVALPPTTAFPHSPYASTQPLIAWILIVTHTANDTAVGLAYPLASRIARQQANALGDENDVYGGIGRNGAVHTPEAVPATLLAVPAPGSPDGYAFEGRKIYNLKAQQIRNHGDVTGRDVAFAVLSAIARGG